MTSKLKLFMFLIIIISLIYRIQHINDPIINWHNFRQTFTATISRNMFLYGIDVFHPKLDIFGVDGKDVLVLEFPLYQATVASLAYVFGFSDQLGKLVAIFFGITGGIILFFLVKKLSGNEYLSILSCIFFLFAPVNVFFHQAFMIESMVVTFHLLTILLWLNLSRKKSALMLVLSIIITSMAYIQKNIYAPFLLLTILGLVFYEKVYRNKNKQQALILGLSLPIILAISWQVYSETTNFKNGHLFFTSFHQNLIEVYIGHLKDRFSLKSWFDHLRLLFFSFNIFSLPFFIIGLANLFGVRSKCYQYVKLWFFSMVLYYLIFFRTQLHAYYIMPTLPVISVICGIGLYRFIVFASSVKKKRVDIWKKMIPLLLAYCLVYLYNFHVTSQEGFFIDEWAYNVTSGINNTLKKPGYVIFVFSQYEYNSIFTYYTNRRGITKTLEELDPEDLNRYKNQGYKYIVFVNISDMINKPKYQNLVNTLPNHVGKIGVLLEIFEI